MSIFIGIDPGISGAMVAIRDGEIIYKARFAGVEIETKGFIKKRIDASLVNSHLCELIDYCGKPEWAALEVFNPISQNSKAIVASLFHTCGVIEGTITSHKIPVIHVPVLDWKKKYSLIKKTKRDSIRVAQIIYPSIGRLQVKEADLAEAALIGHYSKTYLGGSN